MTQLCGFYLVWAPSDLCPNRLSGVEPLFCSHPFLGA